MAPATLIDAARDLKLKEPDFAAQVAVCAVRHLVQGRGYEASPLDIDEAVEHLMVAAERIGASDWALQELRRISSSLRSDDLMADRLARVLSSIDESRKKR